MKPSSSRIEFKASRLWLMAAVSALTLAWVGYVFWIQDGRYSLPTPKPAGLFQPAFGSKVAVPASVAAAWQGQSGNLLFVHVYNAYCPCSRFNLDHVRELYEANRGHVAFVGLVQGKPSPLLLQSLHDKLPGMQFVEDSDGAIAQSFGVYSTPQAVILDRARTLRFRGNYNSSRYCEDRETEYARIALETLLAGGAPKEDPAAIVAYGCPLHRKKDLLSTNLLAAGID